MVTTSQSLGTQALYEHDKAFTAVTGVKSHETNQKFLPALTGSTCKLQNNNLNPLSRPGIDDKQCH